jgi:NAD(P)H-dependent flavin oxidoreductase YrpB (nitropropane dioxygenase family)
MRTRLCELLGIERPIVQAPMGGAVTPRLASAVSEAGGLGTLPVTWSDPASIVDLVQETRALTDRPFGVNLLLAWPQQERLAVALEAGAPVVSLGWDAGADVIQQAKDGGAKVLVTVGTPDEARVAADAGADAVVAQGWEAGGHVWGEIATLALVPAVVDAVDVPVVAAGGIADARGVAAVFALGAHGAWVGTRFLLAEESSAHPEYRKLLLGAGAGDTVHSMLFDGGWPDAPHRTLRNSTVNAWEQAGRPESGSRPDEGGEVAQRADGSPIPRYASSTPAEGQQGQIEAMSLWAGQGVGLVARVQPAAEIVRELDEGADEVLRELRDR